jgi:hypothetical protein
MMGWTPMKAIAAFAVGAFAVALTPNAGADDSPPPTLRSQEFSPYERRAITDALASLHATADDAPEGKTLEGVDIVSLEVLDHNDPVPAFAASVINTIHVTTKRYVVEREVLLRVGQPYKSVTVEESVRNLRALPQLSLVVAVATRGTDGEHVRLLIITKDVWSLRLNWNLQLSSSGLEDLVIQPSEENFLGTHQVGSLYFERDPAAFTFGAGYHAPRLSGTRSVLDASANVVINHVTGAFEGSYGQLLAYQPLFSARTDWAWDSLVAWDQQIVRRFIGVDEAAFPAGSAANDLVPWEYHVRTYNAQESVTRSLGWSSKHDFSLGAYVDVLQYQTTALQAASNPQAVSEFVSDYVPRSDNRVAPFAQYHGYEARFIRVLDFQTLGLQEDYRLGHELYVRVSPVTKALGSSRDFIDVYAAAAYTFAIGDGLFRATVESLTDAQSNGLSDAAIDGGFQFVSPSFRIGRLVYNVHALSRYRNYMNAQSFLGGDTQLRGYPSSFFVGKDTVTSNLEFRTMPVEVLHAAQLGGALFYDVGDAFDGWNNLRPAQSTGFGIRTLFPQLDRLVFRADVGFPVGESAHLPGVAPWSFFIAFGQAFGLPTLTSAALPSGAPIN